MLTVVHTITLPDGRSVQARAVFESPQEEVSVKWSGDLGAIPAIDRLATSDEALLRILFERLASELDGEWHDHSEGQFDLWAE